MKSHSKEALQLENTWMKVIILVLFSGCVSLALYAYQGDRLLTDYKIAQLEKKLPETTDHPPF
jgi:hypothetical protein